MDDPNDTKVLLRNGAGANKSSKLYLRALSIGGYCYKPRTLKYG